MAYYARETEVEFAMVGAALLYEDAASYVASLPNQLFTAEKTRTLHRAIKALLEQEKSVSSLAVSVYLKEQHLVGKLAPVDLVDFVEKAAPGALATEQECGPILWDRFRQRQLTDTAREILDATTRRPLEPRELREQQAKLEQLAFDSATSGHGADAPIHIRDVVSAVADEAYGKAEGKIPRYGAQTGFVDLDRLTGGFGAEDLVLLAGRPSMGKTALATQIAAGVQGPALFVSLEMGLTPLVQRMLAARSGLNLQAIRIGKLSEGGLRDLYAACGDVADVDLWLDTGFVSTPSEIRSRAQRLATKLKQPLAIVVVDYLQLLRPDLPTGGRQTDVADMSRAMKLMAKALRCPVLLLSQLSRECEKRPNKRPMLSDLRDSGAIEQDGDIVLTIYRDHVYNKSTPEHETEIAVLKHRNGPTGLVNLHWHATTASFKNAAREEPEDLGEL